MKFQLLKISPIVLILSVCLLFSQKSSNKKAVKIVNFGQLQKMYQKDNDTTYIVNFFATWCKPCIEEIPEFTKFEKANKNSKMKVIYVSLDFKTDMKKHLIAYLNQNNILESTVLLDIQKEKSNWINLLDSTWSGSIPATLIINNHKRKYMFLTEKQDSSSLSRLIQ